MLHLHDLYNFGSPSINITHFLMTSFTQSETEQFFLILSLFRGEALVFQSLSFLFFVVDFHHAHTIPDKKTNIGIISANPSQ